ncbi:PRC-barrel domain-containing protein [Sneathiella sp. CAU 1612]|jgi:sporulation protein YlmC with PRC-barrel domain|uniref:PRC-barrel domain-containing protein n=1 Tax=Sneathiella sedimenti TaxID=2816034 RepID=A0ABS3FA03_9PROT|nr:PRC-barrel domain-containing protein [Sneathiella sedimenti]MBO0335339.1 PRC-barrel domain-containing protein [Sneathiella sedimenti]
MQKKFLATVSIIALMSAAPALAGTVKSDDSSSSAATMQTKETTGQSEGATEKVKEGWDKTKEAVKETAEDASDATKEAYRDFKAFVFSDNDSKLDIDEVKVDPRTTATGIIGEPVYNFKDERVGVVEDVILNQDGKAIMVIVGDGDFFGLGKLAAFDYDAMVKMNADGDLVMPLTEETIERAAEFSFDRKDMGENVRIMPENAYSVEKLLDAQLVNAKDEKMGEIDDITFKDGQASQLIVGFDKILGFGGEEVSLAYDNAKLIKVDEDEYKYTLAEKKSSLITNYKSATN